MQQVEDCDLVDDISTFGKNAVVDFQRYVCMLMVLELNKKRLCDFVAVVDFQRYVCMLMVLELNRKRFV